MGARSPATTKTSASGASAGVGLSNSRWRPEDDLDAHALPLAARRSWDVGWGLAPRLRRHDQGLDRIGVDPRKREAPVREPPLPDPAVGARRQPGVQGPVAGDAPAGRRLEGAPRLPPGVGGDLRRPGPVRRRLLPGGELAPPGRDRGQAVGAHAEKRFRAAAGQGLPGDPGRRAPARAAPGAAGGFGGRLGPTVGAADRRGGWRWWRWLATSTGTGNGVGVR